MSVEYDVPPEACTTCGQECCMAEAHRVPLSLVCKEWGRRWNFWKSLILVWKIIQGQIPSYLRDEDSNGMLDFENMDVYYF